MKISHLHRLHSIEVFFSILVCLLFFSSQMPAQEDYLLQLGPPPNGSTIPVELGFINLTNGNLHLEVPLGSFPQRGSLPYKASLVYDSRIWVPWTVIGDPGQSFRPFNFLGQFLIPGSQAGWRLELSVDPTFVPFYVSDLELCDRDFYFQGQSWVGRSDFSWTAPDGTVHTFNGNGNTFTIQNLPAGVSPNCSIGDTPDTSGYADDGSGYFLMVTNYDQMTVYAPDGSQFATCANCGSDTPEDSNGNYFSLDGNFPANVVDTLGRTPIITTTNGNQIYYDVLNAQGGRSRYTVTTEDINVSVPNYTTNLTVFKSIGLPNGTSYQFGYEAGTTGDHWGGVNSVTLPTGGVITYGYTTFTDASFSPSNGLGPNSNRWVTSRTSGGGKWTYTPAVISNGNDLGCPKTTPPTQQNTVTKPDSSSIVYKFVAAYAVAAFVTQEIDYYDSGNNLLKQDLVGYNQPSLECPPPPVGNSPPVSSSNLLAVTFTSTLYNGKNTETTQKAYDYTNSPSSDRPTTLSEWDFYSGAPPQTPNRVIKGVYSITNATYAAAHITGKLLSATLADGSGNQVAQTSNTLDDTQLAQTDSCQTTSASQPPPAAPQHDYQNFCTNNTIRGNVTHVTNWVNTSNSSITTQTNVYDDTGNLVSTADALNNKTKFIYSPNFGLAYVTQETDAANEVTTKNYDLNTGLMTSLIDPNGQSTGLQTTYTYDNMGRMTQTNLPDGGQTTVCYSEVSGGSCYNAGNPPTITTTTLATPDPSVVKSTILDGLGRTQTRCTEDPQTGDPSVADCVDTTYDANGREASISNPHRNTAAPTDGLTQYSYDGLDRVTKVTKPDGNTTVATYVLRATQTQDEGNGHAPITKIEQEDAFGNLIGVCEVTSATQAGTNVPSACNLDIAGTGFLTTYQYDLLNNLTNAQQSGLRRSYTYDSLSRMLSATNPESGTTSYGYDNGSRMITRTRAAPNQGSAQTQVKTSYQYDQVNRLTQVTYADGTTPTVTKHYSTTLELGITLKNTVGRLSAEYVTDANNNLLAENVYSYDPMGRITINSQCTPQNCPNTAAFPVAYTYNLNGKQTSSTNGVDVTFSYTNDATGRLSSLTSSFSDNNHPGTLYSGLVYNPLGSLTAGSLGTSLNEAFVWDCRGRVLGYASSVPPATPSLSPPNTPGCPNPISLNIFPSSPNAREPFFRLAGLRANNRLTNSILVGRSAKPGEDHGSIRLLMMPSDPRRGMDALVINYHEAETALHIAHQLAQAINARIAYRTTATVRPAGEDAFVDLSSEEDFFWTRFSPFVSVASNHKAPSVSATVVRATYKGPFLLGQLRSRAPEAK